MRVLLLLCLHFESTDIYLLLHWSWQLRTEINKWILWASRWYSDVTRRHRWASWYAVDFKTDSWIWVEWQSSHHFEFSSQFCTETQFLLVVGFCRIDRRNSILLQYIICMSESTRLLYSSSLEELVAAVYWLFTVESRTTKLSFIYSYLTYHSGSLGRRIFFSSLLPLTLSAK